MEIARFVGVDLSVCLRVRGCERGENLETSMAFKIIKSLSNETSRGEVFYETIGGKLRRCVRWMPRRSSEDRLVASIGGLAKGIIAPDGTIAP